ncbi:MAG: hypothetical protein M1821_000332 [Bathelium mastoideum]|nr:MAG: hypothetical protein M1821_000332 [Bathelium mastoideum]KAI9686140.1 MAG: hypothetical protein M1822_003795 [Bathelium mastoideum]
MYAAILPQRRLVLVGLALSLLTVALLYSVFGHSLSTLRDGLRAKLDPVPLASQTSNLHLVIPATKSKFYFCQLLLSATVLGWPHPVLIGWDLKPGNDAVNGEISHLFKVFRTLEYFNSLPEEQDDDLVVLIDAYDVWFQLRPDVLIQRYYSLRDAADKHLVDQLGASVVAEHGLRQTIFFNADKTLWPNLDTSTDPWWLPNSTLPESAFGPLTDKTDNVYYRPRWLNSGAIIGPLGDMRRLWNVTARRIEEEGNSTLFKDSDQMWFAKIYADQEYARFLLKPNQSLAEEHAEDTALLTPDQETEYHIAMDFKSDLFLANAFYHDYLGWMAFNTIKEQPKGQPMLAPYQIDLGSEVLASPPPFAALDSAWENNHTHVDQYVENLVANSTWRNFMLGTNLISGQVFPLLHVTGAKHFRHDWWDRMWYYPYAEVLLKAIAIAPENRTITQTSADGRIWSNAEGTPNSTERAPNEKIGAWSDEGKWLPWSGEAGICEIYEDYLFGKQPPNPPEELDTELEEKLDRLSGQTDPASQDRHDAPPEQPPQRQPGRPKPAEAPAPNKEQPKPKSDPPPPADKNGPPPRKPEPAPAAKEKTPDRKPNSPPAPGKKPENPKPPGKNP